MISECFIKMRQLDITEQARIILHQLEEQYGRLHFLIGGGCCDGSAPLCFPENDFQVGASDMVLGQIGTSIVYVAEPLAEHYMNKTGFMLDVAPGRGGGFSLEAPLGVRFINRGSW
jgi:uncharacterized protein